MKVQGSVPSRGPSIVLRRSDSQGLGGQKLQWLSAGISYITLGLLKVIFYLGPY